MLWCAVAGFVEGLMEIDTMEVKMRGKRNCLHLCYCPQTSTGSFKQILASITVVNNTTAAKTKWNVF